MRFGASGGRRGDETAKCLLGLARSTGEYKPQKQQPLLDRGPGNVCGRATGAVEVLQGTAVQRDGSTVQRRYVAVLDEEWMRRLI